MELYSVVKIKSGLRMGTISFVDKIINDDIVSLYGVPGLNFKHDLEFLGKLPWSIAAKVIKMKI